MRLPDGEALERALDLFHDHNWRQNKPVIYEPQLAELLVVLAPWYEEEFARKRTRVPARKPAKVDKGNEGSTRDKVRKRSGGTCERCGWRRAETMHHRRFRSQGGPWSPSNILHLCGDGSRLCHGELTAPTAGRRREYEAAGWIVPSHEDWREVPVLRRGERVVLLDDGSFFPVSEGGAA